MENKDQSDFFDHLMPILARHLKYIDEMHSVLGLSIQGIQSLKSLLPGIVKAYEERGVDPDISDDRLNEIRTNMLARAALASAEIERGFPILYSHATVALWGAVEAFSTDLAVGLLQYQPELLEHKSIAKIRIQLALFQRMSEEERLAFLVNEFRQSLSSAADGGIGQYNELFSQLGLEGTLHKTIQNPLIELCQVRNVIVHRSGIVDTQLTSRCPWLDIGKGSHFIVRQSNYETYWNATHRYWLELANRVRIKAGMDAVPDSLD